MSDNNPDFMKSVVSLVDNMLQMREDVQVSVISSVLASHEANGNVFPTVLTMATFFDVCAAPYAKRNNISVGAARKQLMEELFKMVEDSYNDEDFSALLSTRTQRRRYKNG